MFCIGSHCMVAYPGIRIGLHRVANIRTHGN